MKRISALAFAIALGAAACGGQSASDVTTKITVTLTDKAIALSQPSVAPGKVTFVVDNKGTVPHSLVLMRTELPHDKIPADPKDETKVQEQGSILSTGQLAVASTKEFSRDLKAGSYVLVCNEPAHYIVGMHLGFVVK
jgi:uncharacterized cupredoxin-like copper-binding protein